MKTKAKEINLELFSEWFYYDETSPSCLRWKKSKYTRGTKGKLLVEKDAVAGSLRKSTKKGNYWRWSLDLNGKRYHVHRVVWVLLKGSIDPCMEINHLDCDATNNKIDNLEVCTKQQNNRRKTIHIEEDFGFRFRKNGSLYFVWHDSEGTYRTQFFSVRKYGSPEAALDAAEKTRKEVLRKHYFV